MLNPKSLAQIGQAQIYKPNSLCEKDLQTPIGLMETQRRLGITIFKDKCSNLIYANIKDLSELQRTPEFISHISHEVYVCNTEETEWHKIKIRKGAITSITPMLQLKLNWIDIFNLNLFKWDYIVVSYRPYEEGDTLSVAIPFSEFTPDKMTKFFPVFAGKSTVGDKEIGRLLFYILYKNLITKKIVTEKFIGTKQGFEHIKNNRIQFNPPNLLSTELAKILPVGINARQYPASYDPNNIDITSFISSLFSGKKEFQLILLLRIASLHQFLFAKKDINADNIFIVKPSKNAPKNLAVSMLKNTRYDSLNVPSIGQSIKELKFDVENINDGMLVAIDIYAADQLKKAENGYDLLINDVAGANNNIVHHITALISNFADLYIDRDRCCVLDLKDVSVDYSPETYKMALKRVDSNIVKKIECNYNCNELTKTFNSYIDEIRNNIPDTIPHSKVNIYIMLLTALRIYNEYYSPLFDSDIEKYIENFLCSHGQDSQQVQDSICSEFGTILNKKIADGFFKLVEKDEVTKFDKGSHTLIVDKAQRRIYIETSDSIAIGKNEMESIADTDNLTTALYNCGYLPHNSKAEKSIRIAAITSDGVPYPLYVHAISYTLLTQDNKLKFELLNKEANLFTYDSLPREDFLPLVKTVDGRFAGKIIRYEAEESNIYFGTGRTGSGKSWAIAQIIPMLFMLGHSVVVFDVSRSYTKEKLLKMLPADVVEKLFRFFNIGADDGMDKIPVDLGSIKDCETLPDKKKSIYCVLRAAIGNISKTVSRKLKGFLSDYLKNKEHSVSLKTLYTKLELSDDFGSEIADNIYSVIVDIENIGFEAQTWSDLFLREQKIIVINLGDEVGDNTHQLLDMMVGSLFNWQMLHDSAFLSIVIDELIDQDFSTGSPLQTVIKQGRKFHTALIGATQDYFNQGNSNLDAMKQANIKSFCHPGKSEDRVAQKLGYSNAFDAGFNKFKVGDTILEFDGYNKESGANEALTLKGRVVDFIQTPLYEKFKQKYDIQ